MTKRFWAGVMLFSLLMMATSGWYLISALKEKSTQTVSLKKIIKEPIPQTTEEKPPFPTESSPLPDQLEAGATSQNAVTKSTATLAKKSSEPEKPASIKPKVKPRMQKRNILFSLYSSRAKKVHLIGDFTHWKRRPLKKKSPKLWTTTVKLKPGIYKYLYVVDGRRTKDPNKKEVKNGKSVLRVKPITKK